MKLETRLENMKYYRERAIAIGDPSDKLYIEDLNLSIEMFEKATIKNKNFVIMNGIRIDE